MHFTQALLALSPALASAATLTPHWDSATQIPAYRHLVSEVKHTVPTIEEMQRVYPDVTFSNNSALGTRDQDDSEAPVNVDLQNIGYRFAAGGVSAVGYFIVSGKGDVRNYVSSCRGDGDKDLCTYDAGVALVTHITAGLAGFAYGYALFSWIKAGGALQAMGLAPAGQTKRDCLQTTAWSSAYTFAYPDGMRIAGKDNCYKPDDGQLQYIASVTQMIVKGMIENSAYESQFTLYRTSDRQCIGRYHLIFDDQDVGTCEFGITGDDSCTVTV